MGAAKSKIGRTAMIAAAVVLLGSLRNDSVASHVARDGVLAAPIQTAGFGGVLVSKRMRMILGFVQTLPV
ncbi:MAG: hypothetical protein JNK58_05500 [Phycisphaerae bacterium]|nr:hypothetical protein [Phycisphaerae bacterium]